MSKDWTQEELQQASRVMKEAGYMGYEEFCESLEKGLTAFCKDGNGNLIKIVNFHGSKEEFRSVLDREYPHLQIVTVLSQDDIDFIRDALK